MSLFAEPGRPQAVLADPASPVVLVPGWLPPAEADGVLERLDAEVRCEPAEVTLFGQTRPIPRLQAWHGDAGASYRYSGLAMQPAPWTPTLQALRERLERLRGAPRFNSVLINLYRDGRDCVGWHADDERELGAQPVIASLSLGATRRFHLKARPGSAAAVSKPVRLELAHGDLLVMRGHSQRDYLHCAPRTARDVGPRWNLTFRWVGASDATRGSA